MVACCKKDEPEPGNFFVTFNMGFQFGVGDWELFPDTQY